MLLLDFVHVVKQNLQKRWDFYFCVCCASRNFPKSQGSKKTHDKCLFEMKGIISMCFGWLLLN